MRASFQKRALQSSKSHKRLRTAVQETFQKLSANIYLALLLIPLAIYIGRESIRHVIVVDPIGVPKAFTEAGLTSEVVARRIAIELEKMESDTQSIAKTDNLAVVHDEASLPNIEVPGTKMGLDTVISVVRNVIGNYPKHIGGDIVLPTDTARKPKSESAKATPKALITVYLSHGQNRTETVSESRDGVDAEKLIWRMAELSLRQVNPYLFAVHAADSREDIESIAALQRILQSPLSDKTQRSAAFNEWGNVLDSEGKYDEAIEKYNASIGLTPENPLPYYNWGDSLREQTKYVEAALKLERAIQLNPKYESAYVVLGDVLRSQEQYDSAIAKYKEANNINPSDCNPILEWGIALHVQGRYDDAIERYKKALDIDSGCVIALINWGNAAMQQQRYSEAAEKLSLAIRLAPANPSAYTEYAKCLLAQGKYGAAIDNLKRALSLEPTESEAKDLLPTVRKVRDARKPPKSSASPMEVPRRPARHR